MNTIVVRSTLVVAVCCAIAACGTARRSEPVAGPLPRFLMRFQVRHGLGAMPAFPPEVLKDDDVEHILDSSIISLRYAITAELGCAP
jgi:hypothetical protein